MGAEQGMAAVSACALRAGLLAKTFCQYLGNRCVHSTSEVLQVAAFAGHHGAGAGSKAVHRDLNRVFIVLAPPESYPANNSSSGHPPKCT